MLCINGHRAIRKELCDIFLSGVYNFDACKQHPEFDGSLKQSFLLLISIRLYELFVDMIPAVHVHVYMIPPVHAHVFSNLKQTLVSIPSQKLLAKQFLFKMSVRLF